MEKNYTNYIKPYLEELKPLEAIETAACTKISKFKAKALIFDIYGTLLISASGDVDKAEYSSSMVKKALLAANYCIIKDNEVSFDAINNYFNENLQLHLVEGRQEGRQYPEVDIIKVWSEVISWAQVEGYINTTSTSDVKLFTFVFELQTNRIWPMPELLELIAALKLKAIPLGIVSNAQFYTPVIMNYFVNNTCTDGRSIAPFDDAISVFSYEELRGKPDTELFEKLTPGLNELNIKPEETLFIGNDMLKDVYTASQTGFKTVLFGGDERSYRLRKDDERTAQLEPDFVITNLMQLLDIIE